MFQGNEYKKIKWEKELNCGENEKKYKNHIGQTGSSNFECRKCSNAKVYRILNSLNWHYQNKESPVAWFFLNVAKQK